jgi:glycosyltransferase involved in cell wall biosynthesis
VTVRLCFVAAPLIARSGVYNSTIELVTAARAAGLDWTAIIGVSRKASGSATTADGIREFEMEPSGVAGVTRLLRRLQECAEFRDADLVVSMVPQSDMALSLSRRTWVAYLRGLPWPAPGESSRAKSVLWRTLEKLALSRALEVWSTTRVLAAEVGGKVDRLVPPGLVPPALSDGAPRADADEIVWAARFSADKDPGLFLDALSGIDAAGVMYGTGPLEEHTHSRAPQNVDVRGWRARGEIWDRARAYVGTSRREAFGRSAVEAAMLGIPVVLSDAFGCADMLFTDETLRAEMVLDPADVDRWRSVISQLAHDDELHARVSTHVKANAESLTITSAVESVTAASVAVLEETRRGRHH